MTKLRLLPLLFVLIAGLVQAQTVAIGTQVWCTKNLDVAVFRNGDPIPEAKTNEEWQRAGENKQPAWCYYNNDPALGSKYGKLYNWFAISDPRGLAPVGYHLPTDAEWTILENYLGGYSVAGGKMKSTTGWSSYTTGGSKTCPNCASWSAEYRRKVPCHTCKDTRMVPAPTVTHSGNGSNSSGFNGLPYGVRAWDGEFFSIGEFSKWWSSSEGKDFTYKLGDIRRMEYYLSNIKKDFSNVENGLPVRCIKD